MANKDIKRITKVGYKKAETWKVPIDAAGFSGYSGRLMVQTLTGIEDKREVTVDNAAGQGWVSNIVQGNPTPPTPSFEIYCYENDPQSLLLLAQMYGSDAATCGGYSGTSGFSGDGHSGTVYYPHCLIAENQAEKFGTLAWEAGTATGYIGSFAPGGVTISNVNGQIGLTITGKGDQVLYDTTGNLLAGVVDDALGLAFKFKNSTFRMNTQSNAALDSGDEIDVSDLKIEQVRGSDSVIVTGGGTIIQPKEGPYPEFKLTFTVPHIVAAAEDVYAAFAAETLQKADFIVTGHEADEQPQMMFFFPSLKIESCDIPLDEVIKVNVVARALVASSAPQGMNNQTYPHCIITSKIATTIL